VRDLNRAGLYVVLDLHISLTWGPRFGGAGAPRWAAVPLSPTLPLAAVTGAKLPRQRCWRRIPISGCNLTGWTALTWRGPFRYIGRRRFGPVQRAERSATSTWSLKKAPVWPLQACGRRGRRRQFVHLFFVEPPLVSIFPACRRVHTANLVYSPRLRGSCRRPASQTTPTS
jgi:hypothetical protein